MALKLPGRLQRAVERIQYLDTRHRTGDRKSGSDAIDALQCCLMKINLILE